MAALTTLEIVAGIDAAISILHAKRAETVGGNDAVFQKICRAEKHLNHEVEAILGPDPDEISATIGNSKCICLSTIAPTAACPVHGWLDISYIGGQQ